jgi:hypothetical protein
LLIAYKYDFQRATHSRFRSVITTKSFPFDASWRIYTPHFTAGDGRFGGRTRGVPAAESLGAHREVASN